MNKWISVKDSLPSKEYDWVLISPVANENPKDRLVPLIAELRNGKWATREDDGGDIEKWLHVTVTHWMPIIPELPEDQGTLAMSVCQVMQMLAGTGSSLC